MRTNLAKRVLDDAATVGADELLAKVERALRSLKTVDIHLRPIFPLDRAAGARPCPALCSPTTSSITRAPSSPRCSRRDRSRSSRRDARQHRGQGRAFRSRHRQADKPDAPTTGCLCTTSKPSSPISPPFAVSRPPPYSTKNTSSPFTPGRSRPSNAPSTFSASIQIEPSKDHLARGKQKRRQYVIDSINGKFGLGGAPRWPRMPSATRHPSTGGLVLSR